MTEPLTDQQLTNAARKIAVDMIGGLAPGMTGLNLAAEVAEKVTAPYAAEVTRLRAERDRLLAFADWTASNTRPLTDIHTAALTAIDTPSTRAALVDLAQIAAEMAAPACSCGAETVHQHGCQPG